MKKYPSVPPIVSLPEPDRKYVDWDKWIALFMLGILMLLGTHFFISDTQPRETNLKVFVEQQDANISVSTTTLPKNNIQASHFYSMRPFSLPSNKSNGMFCFGGIDDFGDLWGSSMQPTFFEGNTVLLVNYSLNTTLHTGDLIRYFREPCPLNDSVLDNSLAVIHRINAIYDDEIMTQGDNTDEYETIQKCQIVAVVVGILFT